MNELTVKVEWVEPDPWDSVIIKDSLGMGKMTDDVSRESAIQWAQDLLEQHKDEITNPQIDESTDNLLVEIGVKEKSKPRFFDRHLTEDEFRKVYESIPLLEDNNLENLLEKLVDEPWRNFSIVYEKH